MECSTASIEVLSAKNALILSIADDGKGFDNSRMTEGNGLTNMRKRATALKVSWILKVKSAKAQ